MLPLSLAMASAAPGSVVGALEVEAQALGRSTGWVMSLAAEDEVVPALGVARSAVGDRG